MSDLTPRRKLGLFLGPALFLAFLLFPAPEGMSQAGWRVSAVATLMAVWWITEAIPIPATALLPIILFPAFQVMPAVEVTSAYSNHLIYLYLGGFMIAVTIERWGLHRRMALMTIRLVGTSPNRIILGFMLATAALSMWISNTATTMMMFPIGLAVVRHAATDGEGHRDPTTPAFRFGTALMLGIAYSSSIGGVATLIGTPPNAILAGVVERVYHQTISFSSWVLFGLPISAVLLVLTWFYLTRIACRCELPTLPGGSDLIHSEISKLGPMTREEKRVLAVFLSVALAWICRGFITWGPLSMVEDSTIAVAGGVALFLIPSDWRKGMFLLDWRTAVRVPWDIILLFGGGFALANGFSTSGLTEWTVSGLAVLHGSSPVILIVMCALVVVFFTEMTSNAATASLTLPVVAAFAEAVQVHPYALMITVAFAASFAFMMPVATPPNAIVFSSRYVTIPTMARVGFGLNLIATLLLVLAILYWLPIAWGIDLYQFPAGF